MYDLVIGTSWIPAYWSVPLSLRHLPKLDLIWVFSLLFPLNGVTQCLSGIPTNENNDFFNFLFQSGTVEKQIDAAFTDLEFSMFNNISYGNATHTMCMLKKNYGKHVVVGAYTLHDLSKTAAQIASETPVYVNLLRDRVDLFYTDNICDMVQLVEDTLRPPYYRRRRITSPSDSHHRRHSSKHRHYSWSHRHYSWSHRHYSLSYRHYSWRRRRDCNRSY